MRGRVVWSSGVDAATRRMAWGALTVAMVATAASAQTISYPDFSTTAGLQLNGSAVRNGSKLRLTPAQGNQSGSAFSQTTVALNSAASFSTFFSFEILNRGGLDNGADGLTFTVQPNANNVGGFGGGLGYSGIPNSLAVEFDTYDNGETGGSNHVAIDLNGVVIPSVASTPPLSPDFDNAATWYAWVDYNGASDALEVRWAQNAVRPVGSMLSYTVDLPAILGNNNVFVGFTSGTGGGWGEHNILSWQFANEFAPIGTPPTAAPEPATVALTAAGLVVLATAARRRRPRD